MRYVQLRAFHHVATCGGFSRAAEALRLTQPAISDQIRRLEAEYDVHLFNRTGRQVVLTPEGEDLLRITRRMFDNEREAFDLLSERRAFRHGNLRVVADAAHHVIPGLMRFRARYPDVRVTVQAGNSETVIRALRGYEADVGVLGDMVADREFAIVPLGRSPIIAFAARSHPIAARRSLALADLPGLPLVLRETGSRTRARLEAAAAAAGLTLRPAIEAEGREAVREIVAAGAGVGVVSEAEHVADPRLVRLPFRDLPDLAMEEFLVCLAERQGGTLVRAFMDLARED